MSVINQMLKDLEQRTPEQGQAPVPVIQNQKTSTVKVVVISVLVLLTINVLGFYIWDLNNRVASSELKAAQLQEKSDNTVTRVEQKQSDETPVEVSVKPVEKPLEIEKNEPQRTAVQLQKTDNKENALEAKAKQVAQYQIEEKTIDLAVESAPTVIAKKVTHNEVAPSKPMQSKALSQQVNDHEKVSQTSPKQSNMTISRRQLTPTELVEQKLSKAEKAVNANEIAKAEKLFEEVLIIEANNKEARKKLAALWFGRKSYQQAVNLLSQGISLDKQDSELRLLKARIQLQQGQHERAYQTLRPLAHLEQQDYQVMLANVAQQIEAYESAINAFKLLIKMQPYSGKWHLGIAIIYDKNSQFTLAEQAYAIALSKHDLSKASAEFAQQRMQALGE